MTANYSFLGDRPRTAGGGGATGTVAISDQTIEDLNNVSINYRANGNVEGNPGGVLETWVTGTTDFTAYEIRATKLSGANPIGTLGSWLSLGSNRAWTLTATLLTKFCVLRIEIRRASDGSVLDTATVNLQAEGEGGGEL